MDLIFAGIVGWCGTRWPIRFPRPIGPGPNGGDGDPWPIGCKVCLGVLGIIGGVAAVAVMGPAFAGSGMLGTVALAFFGGSFVADFVASAATMARGNK